MTARCFFAVALLVGLAAAAASADEVPARIFHIGIVIGGQRSWPEHVAFEERLREPRPPPKVYAPPRASARQRRGR